MTSPDRYRQAKTITIIGALMNACLGGLKLLGGIVFHSHALVADGIHSFADLLADTLVLFASKYGSLDADDTHPYGHQRIETAATLILSLILILAGVGIISDSFNSMQHAQQDKPGLLALPIAILSIIINEVLFYITRHIGKRIRSDLLIANAWHHRTDAAASAVVLIGIGGSLLGYLSLDTLAALIVGLMIIKLGWSYGWCSVKELVDTSAEPSTLVTIEAIILNIDGVKKIHQLRSRTMGQDIYIDVHVLVAPLISVSEGHFIAQHVHRELTSQIKHVKDVTVHIDPEDDEINAHSFDLPCRSALEQTLLLHWRNDYPAIQSWNLHYLNATVFIDLIVAFGFTQEAQLLQRIHEDVALQSHPINIQIFMSMTR